MLFRYKVDRLPITLFVLYFLFDVVVFALAPWWIALTVAVVGLLPKACICAWNHHHQHVNTFHQPVLNGFMEVIYAFQSGALPSAWVLHHNVGHHVHYLDQEKDESRWARADGSTMGAHEYSFNVVVTAYPRIWGVAQRYPKHRRRFVFWSAVTLVVLACFMAYNPINALLMFIMPMVVGLYVTAWHTYYHHAGLVSPDHNEASWNITHRWYNILTGNLGLHTAHHTKCHIHWSELPTLHAQLAPTIPKRLYRPPCIPFRWMGKAEMTLPDIQPTAAK